MDMPVQLRKDYMHVFGTEAGKRVLEDLRLRGYKYTTTFDGTTEGTLVNEGSRRIVMSIENAIDPENLKRVEGGSDENG